MEDLFIREHIEDLLRNIRTQVLVKLIRPYTRVRIGFIAQVHALLLRHVHILVHVSMYVHTAGF